eukprot:g67826.t1
MSASKFSKRPVGSLFVSEPPPSWFGNPANPAKDASSGWTNANWLRSRFHFSFAEYSDHKNDGFGVLRVMNDDLVQPSRGFGTHPHANMEIVTLVVNGHLTHKDSMGTAETLGRGAIQYMTAGTGVRHSEHNLHKTDALRFIQIWIQPAKRNLKPQYGSFSGGLRERLNQWQHLVGPSIAGAKAGGAVRINQDANLYLSELQPGKDLELSVGAARQAYLLAVEGKVNVSGADLKETLAEGDAVRIGAGSQLRFSVPEKEQANALLLVVEMAQSTT